MRAILAVSLCMALVACDSDDKTGEANDAAPREDAALREDAGASDARTVEEDAEVDVDAEVDASVEEDAEVDAEATLDAEVDAQVEPDAEVVPDAEVDSAVPLTADQQLELDVIAKFRSCNVLSATGDYKDAKVKDGFDRCLSQCYLAAACAPLRGFQCDGAENSVYTCTAACWNGATTDWFQCGGALDPVPHLVTCDAAVFMYEGTLIDPGCANKADDVNCPAAFACASGGQMVNAALVCNGDNDCSDGSDETGCAKICP